MRSFKQLKFEKCALLVFLVSKKYSIFRIKLLGNFWVGWGRNFGLDKRYIQWDKKILLIILPTNVNKPQFNAQLQQCNMSAYFFFWFLLVFIKAGQWMKEKMFCLVIAHAGSPVAMPLTYTYYTLCSCGNFNSIEKVRREFVILGSSYWIIASL